MEPATATGAATALAWLEAGSAVAGTGLAIGQAAASGDSGFHVGQASVKYPNELDDSVWVGEAHDVDVPILRFEADGYLWDNTLNVTMSGFASHAEEDMMCLPDSDNPNVPVNRWFTYVFGIAGGSEDMSQGLLTVEFDSWEVKAGSADHPKIPMRVSGRFDPVGFGDSRYEIRFSVDSFGQVELDSSSSSQCSISLDGDTIVVRMDQ